jgi:hypothetical protein
LLMTVGECSSAERFPVALPKVEHLVTAVRLEDSCSGVLVDIGWHHDQEPSSSQVLGCGHELFVLIPQVLDEAVNAPPQPVMTTAHIAENTGPTSSSFHGTTESALSPLAASSCSRSFSGGQQGTHNGLGAGEPTPRLRGFPAHRG